MSGTILAVRFEVFWSKGRKEAAAIMTEIRPVTTGSWTPYGANSVYLIKWLSVPFSGSLPVF